MHRSCATLLGCFFVLALHAIASAAPKLEVVTDRPEAIYAAGEKVTFKLALEDRGKPVVGQSLKYVITKDGFAELATGTVEPQEFPVTVEAKLDEPGVIRCDVTCKPPAATQAVSAAAGAAIDPDQIKASQPAPDDFDSFWAAQRQLLAADPPKPVLTKVEVPDANIEVFDVQVNCPGGAPVSGYLAKPKDAKPKSLPAILYPHSAGVRSSDLPHAVKGAKMGLLALDFNAHGISNGKPASFYENLFSGDLKGYPARGRDDRETVYFRGMILRLMRTIDFLAAQPEWDGRILIVEGSSQGGGQALIAAGLDPRVSLCLAAVPALCDHTGFLVNRASGWPRIVPKDVGGKYDAKVAQAVRYVDAINFAGRIKCPTWVTVGFIDKTVAPTSVYAAYNNIPAGVEKHILPQPLMGHAFPAELIAKFDEVIRQHVAKRGH